MGATSSYMCNPFGARKSTLVLISGLDGCGKSSIMLRYKWGEFYENLGSSVSFSQEEVTFNNSFFLLRDLGASLKLRKLHLHMFDDAKALIYVIDSADKDRVDMAREELHDHLADPAMKGLPLLVFATKRDLPDVISIEELEKQLAVKSIEGRQCKIMSSSAKTGEGLLEGLSWLEDCLREKE